MKRIICLILTLVLALSCTTVCDNIVSAKKKKMEMISLPSVKNIKIKITKGKKVAYYKIYRAVFTEEYVSKLNKSYIQYVPKKKYKFIAKTKKLSFIDKKVKKMKLYRYGVKGFNKKGKCIESFYDRESYVRPLHIGNIETPVLFYDDYNDEYGYTKCSSKKLVIYCRNNYGGPCVSSYILYRKEEGEKKFKKLFEKKNRDKNTCAFEKYITDTKVKANHKYYYKVKLCLKNKKKKYYSKMSNQIMLHAVDDPYYSTKCMTKSFVWDCNHNPDEQHDFVFMISKTSNNIPDIIYPSGGHYYSSKHVSGVGFHYNEYSYNNLEWFPIPENGLELTKGKTIYIKCTLSPYTYEGQKLNAVFFEGADDKNAHIYIGSIGNIGVKGMRNISVMLDFYKGYGYPDSDEMTD